MVSVTLITIIQTSKVKFAACTFIDRALSWWNGHFSSLTLPIAPEGRDEKARARAHGFDDEELRYCCIYCQI